MIARALVIACLVILALGEITPSFAIESAGTARERKAREATEAIAEGDKALNAKNYDQAIGAYTKAIDGKGVKDDVLGQILYRRGVAHQALGNCAAAVPDYDQAAQLMPGNGDLLFNRSLCHEKMGQPDKALADVDAAIKANPDNANFRSARCGILFNKKNFAGAIPDCEAAIAAKPDDKQMLLAAAQAYEQTGNKPKAIELYQRLLKVDPGNTTASEAVKRLGG